MTEIILLHNAHGSSPEVLVCIFIDMLAGIVVDIAVQLDSLQLGVCMGLCTPSSIRASVDALCRDGPGEISRDRLQRGRLTRQGTTSLAS